MASHAIPKTLKATRLFVELATAEPACEAVEANGLSEFDQIFPDAPVKVESLQFVAGNSQVEHTVSAWPNSDAATATFDEVRDLEVASCFVAIVPLVFERSLDEVGGELTSIEVVEDTPQLGDDAWGIRGEFDVSAPDGSSTTFVFALTAVVAGRAVSALSVLHVVADPLDVDATTRLAHDRVASAFG